MRLKTWIDGVCGGARGLVRRLAGDVRGNVAMLFGLSLPVLVLMTFGGVDIHRLSTVKVNLQDALDAATLAAARSPYTTDAELKQVGLASLRANLQAYPDVTLQEDLTTFTLSDGDVVIADARVQVKTLVANIFLPPYGKMMDDTMPIGGHSEVDRSSRNIEVALVLDVTQSMSGQRILDLKSAAKDLVEIIVQPVQTPYYSKIALVPYSMAVNVGTTNANAVRGAPTAPTAITGATINLDSTEKTITAATKAKPVVITSMAHGFNNNDVIWISGATGMTQLNNKAYRVRSATANTFQLYSLGGNQVNGSSYGSYTGTSGKIRRCQNNDCSITIVSNNHGLSNNEYVYINGVGGMTEINNKSYLVGNATTNTFTIDPDLSALTPYTSGGQAWCAQQGCRWFTFETVYGDLRTYELSTCVTERTGSEAYTDASPTTALIGRSYLNSPSGDCLAAVIQPLSSDIAALKTSIDGYTVKGTTAGQIGIGWGWYMVSPNFNHLWPSNGAGPYNTADTLKAVIIMTDGEFNTPYCQGVIARDASYGGSGRIDCDAENGDPFTQGEAMCEAMRDQGILIYTVGFQITAGGEAANMLEDCASTPANFYLPASGGDLSQAFAAIGRDITKLRISR